MCIGCTHVNNNPSDQYRNRARVDYWYRQGTNGPFRGVKLVDENTLKTWESQKPQNQDSTSFGDHFWHSVTTKKSKPSGKRKASLETDKLGLICYKNGQETDSFFSFLKYAISIKYSSSVNDYHKFLEHIEGSTFPRVFKKFFEQFCDDQVMKSSPTNVELETIDSFDIGFIHMVVERAMTLRDLSGAIREFQHGISR